MGRLLRDRYFAYHADHGWDLATGETVRLDEDLPDAAQNAPPMAALVEVLDHGRDGAPRWIEANPPDGETAEAMLRRAAADAAAHGYVPIAVEIYLTLGTALGATLDERSLVLLAASRTTSEQAREALLLAASRCPRPHVLLTIRSAAALEGGSLRVREARAIYGVPRAPGRALPPIDADVAHHLKRAARAGELVRVGRHAAAERLLRDVAGALARRRRSALMARVLLALGRLQLERGRAQRAEAAFEEAASAARAGGEASLATDARLWQAAARTDAARLTEAESLCRAVIVTGAPDVARTAWAHAVLARVLLWQGRVAEAQELDLTLPTEHDLDAATAAFVDATAVRVCAAGDRLFEAGQRANALARSAAGGGALERLMAAVAHLRVLVASGDLDGAAGRLDEVVRLAREIRAPLRAARARLLWAGSLVRAGRTAEGQGELRRLGRLCAAAPPLLARAVAKALRAAQSGDGRGLDARRDARAWPRAADSTVLQLVTMGQEEVEDGTAVQRVLEILGGALGCSRVDLWSADAGPASHLLSVGTGVSSRLGPRVLEAGLTLGPEPIDGGPELGVPVRRGRTLVAAIAGRWPADRAVPGSAAALFEIAAAVAGPRIEAVQAAARRVAEAATAVPELIGTSAAIAEVRGLIARAAAAPFAVLIEGESGVGKELAARAIHQLSPRRERRFCDINCAALPDELLESELFGHARGAFTGAVHDRAGLFEEADGGTVFLDELADLSPRGQAKLLRVLQQQEVRRIGESFSRKVDVRLVTAANREMAEEVAAGRFRQDLLYRLDVIRIRIPPLRERPADVALLAQHFWSAAAQRVGTRAVLTHGLVAALTRYHWPGNVRELQNVMAALAVAAPARGQVRAQLLPPAIAGAPGLTRTRLADARAQFERRVIESALARAAGSRTRAARELGLSRQGLLKMMARLGIQDPAPYHAPVAEAR